MSSLFHDGEDHRRPIHLSQLRNLSPYLGVGLALGLTTMLSRNAPKPLKVAIKLTNSALTIPKFLLLLHHFTPQEFVLVFSKSLVETYKVGKKLNLLKQGSTHRTHFSRAVRTLKPCLGAAGLLECSRHFSAIFESGFGVLSYGYKFSKNFIKVLKGVGLVELDDVVRNGLKSLGLVVKAVKVAKEIKHIKKASNNPDPACWICSCTDSDGILTSNMRLVSSYSGRMLGFESASGSLIFLPFCWSSTCCDEEDAVLDEADDDILRELLCLSIHIDRGRIN